MKMLSGEFALDIGCGTGLAGRAFSAAGFRSIDGCDISRPSFAIRA
jgi:predicted TPR repeat methyltransferase